jgi:hypothetical protein
MSLDHLRAIQWCITGSLTPCRYTLHLCLIVLHVCKRYARASLPVDKSLSWMQAGPRGALLASIPFSSLTPHLEGDEARAAVFWQKACRFSFVMSLRALVHALLCLYPHRDSLLLRQHNHPLVPRLYPTTQVYAGGIDTTWGKAHSP